MSSIKNENADDLKAQVELLLKKVADQEEKIKRIQAQLASSQKETKVATKKGGKKKTPLSFNEELENNPIWLHFVSMLVLNINLVRTDRHGSPVAVLRVSEDKYVIVIYAPLIRAHLSNVVSCMQGKGGPRLSYVSNQWTEIQNTLSNKGFFEKGKSVLTEQQINDLRCLWGVSPDLHVRVFKKRIVAIQGEHLDPFFDLAIKSKPFKGLKKAWIHGTLNRDKVKENAIPNDRSYFYPIRIQGAICNNIPSLISDDEIKQVLNMGFSGLGLLLESPSLNKHDERIKTLPWLERRLRGGWICESLIKGWPTWEQVVADECFVQGDLMEKEYYMEHAWWYCSDPQALLDQYVTTLKRKSPFEKCTARPSKQPKIMLDVEEHCEGPATPNCDNDEDEEGDFNHRLDSVPQSPDCHHDAED